MIRWQTIILATLAAAALAGCGTSHPAAAGPPSPVPQPAAASATAAATAAVIYLTTSEQVPFTGDVVTLRAQAAAGTGTSRWLRLASVTISFGDGSAGLGRPALRGRPPGAGRPRAGRRPCLPPGRRAHGPGDGGQNLRPGRPPGPVLGDQRDAGAADRAARERVLAAVPPG